MDNVNNQRTVAFLEDLNVRLKRFDEMILSAREDITRAIATLDAQRTVLGHVINTTAVCCIGNTAAVCCPNSEAVMNGEE